MGDWSEQLSRNAAVVLVVPPIDMVAGAVSGVPVSLKGWDHCTVIAHTGAVVAGTCAITLTQDTTVTAAGDVIALAFTSVYTNEAAPGSNTLLPVTVASTDNLAVAASTYVIEIDADDLSDAVGAATGNRFDVIRCELSAPGNNDLVSVEFILTKGRYTGPPATIKDATID